MDLQKHKCHRCRDRGYLLTMFSGHQRRCRCNPAPKPPKGPRSATHQGECGVCERVFTVAKDSERLALHGFSRPGHGWIVGECPGQGRLPVERSAETLAIVRDMATNRAIYLEGRLAALRTGQVTELRYEIARDGSRRLPRSAPHSARFETVTVKLGAPADYRKGIPSFNDLLGRMISETERDVSRMRDLERRAKERISAWAPRELKPIG